MNPTGCIDGLITIPTPDGPELTACRGRCCTRPGPADNNERLLPMYEIVQLRNGRTAIRHNGVLLAVPTMHDGIPYAIRQQVYELIQRRCFGEAYDLAQDAEDARRHRSASSASIAALMKAKPYVSSLDLRDAA